MPATFSHPPAIVPFVRYGGILSALVIGTMLPDSWHMVPDLVQRYETHSLVAQLNFTVPVGLICLFAFHAWLKRPLLALTPYAIQQRVYGLVERPFAWWPFKRFGAILFSLWLGGFIHILWDSFTHNGGWMVRNLTPLRKVVFISNNSWMGREPVTVAWFLQHISSTIGFLLLCMIYAQWHRTATVMEVPPDQRISTATRIAFWIFTVCASLLAAKIFGDRYTEWWAKHFLATSRVPKLMMLGHQGMAAFNAATLCVLSFCVWYSARKRKGSPVQLKSH